MSGTGFSRGVALPMGILLLAFAILFFAGQAGSLGPLEPATYRWFLLALWIAAPVAGGIAASRLTDEDLTKGAAVLGLALGLAVAAFLLTAAGTASSCREVGTGSAAGYVIGCLAVGAVVGVGTAVSELVTALLSRRGWMLLSVLLGGGTSLVTGVAAFVLYYSVVTCLR